MSKRVHIVNNPKAVYLFQKLGIVPSLTDCSHHTGKRPTKRGKCWTCIEIWLTSRGWHQEAGTWIDPTGLDHSAIESALGWQIWTDASVLFDRLGWGGWLTSRGSSDCRILGPIQVPREITKKSKTIRCSATKALEYYVEDRVNAETLAEIWLETGGNPMSGVGPYLPVSFRELVGKQSPPEAPL